MSRDETPSQSVSRQSALEEDRSKSRSSREKLRSEGRSQRTPSIERSVFCICCVRASAAIISCLENTPRVCLLNSDQHHLVKKRSPGFVECVFVYRRPARGSSTTHRPPSGSSAIHIPSTDKPVLPKYNVVELLEKGHTLR